MTTSQQLFSHYPIITNLSQFLSTLDLFNLALTCRTLHSAILGSPPIFDKFKRTALCDGHGVRDRQNFKGLYRHTYEVGYSRDGRRQTWRDEPIEVRLWAVKCDETGALPCVKCGINVCEECRWYPREPVEDPLTRRPHLNETFENSNVFCLCATCDLAMETSIRGQYLHELCDCDVFKRWICSKCKLAQTAETQKMYRDNTCREITDEEGEMRDDGQYERLYRTTKGMFYNGFAILFFCPCGSNVPRSIRPRCTWCKRHHRPEEEWADEMQETWGMPDMIFEVGSAPVDPCYPVFVGEEHGDNRGKPYPKLAYGGPKWPERIEGIPVWIARGIAL